MQKNSWRFYNHSEDTKQEAGFPVGHRKRCANFLRCNLAGQKIVVRKNTNAAFINLPWIFMRRWRAHLDILQIKLFHFIGFKN